MREDDWPRIAAIYREGIATGNATFATDPPSIFPENGASLAHHSHHGFRVVGQRERIAQMEYGPYAGQWRDTVLIERRSVIVVR